MKHILTVDSFSKEAPALRGVFEDKFKNLHHGGGERFVWDFWNVPDQYRMLRTPAYHYFPQKLYRSFHESLVQWGRENLGCHDVSPPWLSCYTEGCRQELHADVPHGPWAFVFSLSPRKISYRGGETLILKPRTLDYWRSFSDAEDREHSSFVDRIPAKFNRLTVFDPRFPHGVTEVRGVEDPLAGRLVIHGWFVEPRPYVVGALTTTQVAKALQPALNSLSDVLQNVGDVHGTVSLRLQVSSAGQVKKVTWLTDTVIGLHSPREQSALLKKHLNFIFKRLTLPKAKGLSKITVPLLFK